MSKFTDSKIFEDKYKKMADHNLDRYFEAKKAMDEKEAIVNAFLDMMRTQNSDVITDLLNYALVKQHRTHQQLIIKNLFSTFKKYVEVGESDARNLAALEWLEKITENEVSFPYI